MTQNLTFESFDKYQNYTRDHPSQTFVVHSSNVYNVTTFLQEHPGGPDYIQEFKNQNVTETMASDEYHNHSENALRLLQKYKIGELSQEHTQKVIETCKEESYPKITQNKIEYKDFHIDLTVPIVSQVLHLNKKQYMHMIHNAINLRFSRLFANNLFEHIFTNSWYRVPIIWIPVALYMLYHGISHDYNQPSFANKYLHYSSQDFSIVSVPFALLFGCLIWTLAEYFLHRGLKHFDDDLPDNKYARYLHFIVHGIHHMFPKDLERVVYPPALVALSYMNLAPIILFIFPGNLGRLFGAGFLIGYIYYDISHIYIHTRNSWLKHLQDMKKYHGKHHYVDPSRGFGITSKIWDRVFRTELLN